MSTMAAATSTSTSSTHRLIVGTFNTPELFVVAFEQEGGTLQVEAVQEAVGNHSWLALDERRKTLLATCWTDPPAIASYGLVVGKPGAAPSLTLLGRQDVKARSGYVTVARRKASSSEGSSRRRTTAAYTAGGPTGEVLALDAVTGMLLAVWQETDYITGAVRMTDAAKAHFNNKGRKGEEEGQDRSVTRCATNGHANGGQPTANNGSVLDFGGLRHGAHSADLSPDGAQLYVADIGRNCVWVHGVDADGLVSPARKVVSPRANDGPRHVWPHPNGKLVYVLQEHTSIVDVFRVEPNTAGVAAAAAAAAPGQPAGLTWVQGVRIIPEEEDEGRYWADEVRTVAGVEGDQAPALLVASTRGLESSTLGFVALFPLTPQGFIDTPTSATQADVRSSAAAAAAAATAYAPHPHAWLDMWQSPTSGGWANAVEPCARPLHAPRPVSTHDGTPRRNAGQYVALTDSERGLVMMLNVEHASGGGGGARLREVARVELGTTADGTIRGAATAVWLD